MKSFIASSKRALHLGKREPSFRGYEVSDDGDHGLRKEAGQYCLWYDNGRDLREWRFCVPENLDEELIWQNFQALTGRGRARFEFFHYLESVGIVPEPHDWH